MNVSFVNPFITATVNMFKTMINLDVKPGMPRVKTEPFPTYDISGIIGLSGEAQGTIALSFPKVMALRLVSQMLGTEIKVVGDELCDGVGELANIVAGNAKQGLANFKLSISLPNVVIGKNHMLRSPSGLPSIVVPFASTLGSFAMEVSLKTK
jgi:chemotaxis protein CheX